MNKDEWGAAVEVVKAITDIIRELGEVPSGHLYAALQGAMTLQTYYMLIGKLQQAGLIKVENHLIRWVGGDDTVEVRVTVPVH